MTSAAAARRLDTPAGELLTGGAPLAEARAAVLLLHGRGATAADILDLAPHLDPGGTAFLAPQAPGGSWYPASFLAPFEHNEPALTAALRRVRGILGWLEESGLPGERLVVAGFSQGACLAIESAARAARRYAGVVALTGGRIGPPATRFGVNGSFAGTPVLLTAGDPDPHVPWWRVEETAHGLRRAGARVDLRRYPGRPHGVSGDEIQAAAELLRGLEPRPRPAHDRDAG